MLDSALSVVGIPCATLGGYIADRRYKLIKVHGSVDWATQRVSSISETARRWLTG
jgi:hypothetical protein